MALENCRGLTLFKLTLQSSALWNSPQTPPHTSRAMHRSFSPSSDGACPKILPVYVFIGSILIEGHTLRIIAGTAVGFAGLGYAVLEFVPSIEAPSTMREADATWGAEQV
ncbi:uncharacterized protein PADG_05498 [Paracoccidioides brasiliensis Pb18]|uniref:Uncharacterized protein n=1 Tax=Paracoccidioides brasiliensis (strain Pb18) TaxID=502780 RepID=C1GE12_PARBD|nr:uncharacterized protein PADG_05498 [Paracoccidioides brasiliensis Pb18]EEH49419.2 hypothetical protein PADG_05498 [Paracoccidioides brasiliensis Pb18]